MEATQTYSNFLDTFRNGVYTKVERGTVAKAHAEIDALETLLRQNYEPKTPAPQKRSSFTSECYSDLFFYSQPFESQIGSLPEGVHWEKRGCYFWSGLGGPNGLAVIVTRCDRTGSREFTLPVDRKRVHISPVCSRACTAK
jgi:hypothetical protein